MYIKPTAALHRCLAGRSGFWFVIFFQQVASIGNNLTIQIVAGQSAKVCTSYSIYAIERLLQ